MSQFQVSVSIGGRFVFRSEWIERDTAYSTFLAMMVLVERGYVVDVNHRPYPVYSSTQLTTDTTNEQIKECFGL